MNRSRSPSAASSIHEQRVANCLFKSSDHGTTVEYLGRTKGPIAGKEFADALFRTWLGPKSIPGEEFKKQLLGG